MAKKVFKGTAVGKIDLVGIVASGKLKLS